MSRSSWCADVVQRSRRSRSVVVAGPAGMGKTTAVREISSTLRADGRTVLVAVASPTARRIPMGAIAPLVPVEAVSRSSPSQRIAAVADLLAGGAGRAARGPTVLVVDEADHLDDESAVVVQHLVASRTASVLAAVRSTDPGAPLPPLFERLRRDGDLDVMWVPPLDPNEAGSMLSSRLGGVVADDTVRLLHAVAEGNPLQLDELVRHNIGAGRIVQRRGVWVGADLEPTTSIAELIRIRISTIRPATLRALRVAALAGPVHQAVLAHVAGDLAIAEAIDDGLMVVSRPGVLAVCHPMVAETIVAACPASERVALLEAAVDGVLAAPDTGSDWAVPLASWMLALVDRGTLGPQRLLDVATRMVADLRPDLGERLALAAGADGGERAAVLVARTRAMQGSGPEAVDVDLTPAVVFEAAVGSFEAFVLGFTDAAGVRAAFERAESVVSGAERDELVVLDTAFGMYRGDPVDLAIDALEARARRHEGTPLACIAGANAIVGLTEVGRFHAAVDIGRVMVRSGAGDNAFHDTQQVFSTAEALHRLGRRDEALELVDTRLMRGATATSPMAAVFGAAMVAQVAIADGRPDLAAPQLATVLAAMGGIDAAGIGSWAERGLRLCRAWGGERAPAVDRIAPVPPQGMFQLMVCRLFEVQTLLAGGQRVSARAAAIDLAHDAASTDHRFVALRAVHLACTVSATQALADWAGELAATCDGELVAALAEHAGWLARADGIGLEKAGHAFVALGQAELALGSFRRAEDELRRRGSSTAARRAAAAAEELVAAGTISMVPSARLGASHGLTPRELEVAELAASGMSSRAIAGRIGVSSRTVETHLQHAYVKLGVHDRQGLVASGFESDTVETTHVDDRSGPT